MEVRARRAKLWRGARTRLPARVNLSASACRTDIWRPHTDNQREIRRNTRYKIAKRALVVVRFVDPRHTPPIRAKRAPMNLVVAAPDRMSRADELANCVTHALGFALAVAGTVALWEVTAQYGDSLQRIGVAIYGVTLVALYAASTLSHIFVAPR